MASHGSLLMYVVLHVLKFAGWLKHVELTVCFFFWYVPMSVCQMMQSYQYMQGSGYA